MLEGWGGEREESEKALPLGDGHAAAIPSSPFRSPFRTPPRPECFLSCRLGLELYNQPCAIQPSSPPRLHLAPFTLFLLLRVLHVSLYLLNSLWL